MDIKAVRETALDQYNQSVLILIFQLMIGIGMVFKGVTPLLIGLLTLNMLLYAGVRFAHRERTATRGE